METESFAMGDCYLSSVVPSFKAFFAASCTWFTVSLNLPSVLESTNSPALSIAEPTVSAFCASKSLALSRNPIFRPLSVGSFAIRAITTDRRVATTARIPDSPWDLPVRPVSAPPLPRSRRPPPPTAARSARPTDAAPTGMCTSGSAPRVRH